MLIKINHPITMRYRVVTVQKILTHYRKPFHELLKERLAEVGIELVLIYGSPSKSESQKKDNVEIAWARGTLSF